MEPIINPWLFYLMSIVDSVKLLSILVTVVIGAILLVWGIRYYSDYEDIPPIKTCTCFGSLFLFFLMLSVFVPTESTVMKMIICKNITYERTEKALKVGKELHGTLKQDIIEIIQEVAKATDKKNRK